MSTMNSSPQRIPVVVLCGPTAAGKTALSLRLAERWPVEIVSADSRQVYRCLDIGTAKPTREERAAVPHHLIDVVDPDEDFTVHDFVRLGREAIAGIVERGRLPLLVGGTGLYIRALTGGLAAVPGGDEGLRKRLIAAEAAGGAGTLHRQLQVVDPLLAERLKPGDRLRIVRALEVYRLSGRRLSEFQAEHAFAESPYRLLVIGLTTARDELYRRIDRRSEQMFTDGLLAETANLLRQGYARQLKSLRTIGYREAVRALDGELSVAEALALVQRESRRYAKRQLTWFGHLPEIIWVDSLRESDRIPPLLESFMQPRRSGHGQDTFQYPGSISQPSTQGAGARNGSDDVGRKT
ncbi:MAG: tRNA (adenosine(37)-N6)-dimethylallyltransferase MiaA [Desulfuromonadales bacterium GWD2_61_12]|nr:MAG: tRNA (adenosine(37)-N6)-dimethylallyltransferase MiaA [Desulfuromonadales bacterium GWC2_61_20]OGR32471.1 MAG: tRNA (adenosine(37)-N6)-dimethylallyltransferase MiaA [Desulfuromonadales bacterium GWD2_61_12]